MSVLNITCRGSAKRCQPFTARPNWLCSRLSSMLCYGLHSALTIMLRKRASCVLSAGALCVLLYFDAAALAQNPAGQLAQPQAPAVQGQQALPPIRANYVLGSNDQILIREPEVEEINGRPFRIDSEGFITLPLIGRVRAAGLSVQALEADVISRLRQYVREPQVTITVVQFRSEPVFVMGEFRAPGIYPLEGRTLVELLSTTGGLLPTASRRIKITRRAEYGAIPLAQAIDDRERNLSTVEISMTSLSESSNPAEDLVLKPYDIVSVERAERIYVSGEVLKPGPIEFGARDTIPVSQALTEAGGFALYASRNKVRVLRPVSGTSRNAEIDIDLKRVFEGKDNDFPLLPNDVLFVPRATAKAVLTPVGTAFLAGVPYLIITSMLR
jgi:polysaccharide biosynthesis/export protein